MKRRTSFAVLSVFLVASPWSPACDSASHDTTGSGAATSTGNKTSSSTGMGGMTTATGVSTTGMMCAPVAGYDPVQAGLPNCCTKGSAHCVPATDVPTNQQFALSSCTDKAGGAGLCEPDVQIKGGNAWMAQTCASIGGAPGVCLSICVKAVNSDPNVGLLVRGTCANADELCAPCVNPLTNQSTHACDPPSCDTAATTSTGTGMAPCPYMGPPLIDPTTLDACAPSCGGAHCVLATAVPTAEQSKLASCMAMGQPGFCVPDNFIKAGGNLIAATCSSLIGSEGRCLSDCLPSVAAQQALLPTAGCATGERCTPCYDPRDGSDTGACHLSCDPGPAMPPKLLPCPYTGPAFVDPSTLPQCTPSCGGAHCMPAIAVPVAQQPMLTTCPGGFCLSDDIIAAGGKIVPKTCNAFTGGNAEGRCLSKCLGSVASQASQLHQDVCASDQLCAPCYDPRTGNATGACSLSTCDAPVKPPYTFPKCCSYQGSYQGTCVPKDIIPASQAGALKPDTCMSGSLCVPNEYLPGGAGPMTCTAPLGAAGTCVSNCANSTQIFPQATCASNHECIPCAIAKPQGAPGCP